ncbi:MAG: nickel insertion protein, partial [Caldilinea sp.]
MSLFWAGHLDLPSGVSGDMLLGCLVDAGWPVEQLVATVQALQLPAGSWSVHAERVARGPIVATRVQVSATEGPVHRHLREIEALLAAAELPPT